MQSFDDKCLLAPGSVLNKQGHHFKVFTPFKRAYIVRLSAQPLSMVKTRPAQRLEETQWHDLSLFSATCSFSYPRQSSERYCVKTNNIRQKLRDFCENTIDHYHLQRDIPSLDATSQLSPYLAIGALSTRQCLARLHYGHPPPLSEGREIWLSELIWRDFYQHLLHFEPKLSKGHNFVAWTEKVQWRDNPRQLRQWQSGRTGYPIVDAAMRQLNQTGWMHNRLRMIVASFLTKNLHIHWRQGERYFMSMLVDGDYAANNGGWQWSASTGCDGQPYFRMFNPTTQGERFDPEGDFIRHWLPELKVVPRRYIHQPWKWENVNMLSYPKPMISHKSERAITLQLFQAAKDSNDAA